MAFKKIHNMETKGNRYLLGKNASFSLVENFIYNELRGKLAKQQIYFYRTISKSEIDFVLQKQDELILLP